MSGRSLAGLILGLVIGGSAAQATAVFNGSNQLAGITGVPVTIGANTTYYDVDFQFGEFSIVFGSESALPAGWPFTNSSTAAIAVSAIVDALNTEGVPATPFAGGQTSAYVPFNIGPQVTATGSCDLCVASRNLLYSSSQWASSGSTPWVKTTLTTLGGNAGPEVTWARFTVVPAPGGLGLLLTGIGLLVARTARQR